MDPRDVTLLKCYQEEIQRHHMLIQDLKSKMNLLWPICKLPPEILSIIFSFVKGGQSYVERCRQAKGIWISEITHICRHWRTIALNAPTLWNDPPEAIQRLAPFLARSKSTALYIEWTDLSLYYGRLQPLEQLLEHTSRIRNLRLRSFEFAEKENNMLLQISSRQLGLLEVLELSKAIIPDALLVETKALRELHLRDCTVHWESFTRNDLKILDLSNLEAPNPSSPTLSRLLGIVGHMASLTSLVLRHAFVSRGEVYPRVHLSNLQIFVVESSLVGSIALLQFIVFPATARVNITADLRNHQTEEINMLFAAIKDARSPAPSEDAAYHTFSYAERDYHDDWKGPHVGMSLFTKAIDIYPPKGFELIDYVQPNFGISLKWQDRDLTSSTNIRSALAAFMDSGISKMDSVKYVFLESNLADTYSNAASLASTIGHLSTVSDVLATGGMMKTLSKALRLKLTDSEQYSFPNLAVVSLLRHESFAFWEMNEDYDFDVNILITSLHQRKRDNAGVQKVGFDDACHQSIIEVGDNLRKLFESVNWGIQLIDLYRKRDLQT